MRIVFTPNGWADYIHWQTTDRATLKRVNRLIDDVLRDPTGRHRQAGAAPSRLRRLLVAAYQRRAPLTLRRS